MHDAVEQKAQMMLFSINFVLSQKKLSMFGFVDFLALRARKERKSNNAVYFMRVEIERSLFIWSEQVRFSGLVSFMFKSVSENKNKRSQSAKPGELSP